MQIKTSLVCPQCGRQTLHELHWARAARRQKVPHTVAHDQRICDGDPQLMGGLEEEVGIRFGSVHEITGDDRYSFGYPQHLDVGTRGPGSHSWR